MSNSFKCGGNFCLEEKHIFLQKEFESVVIHTVLKVS